MNTAGIEDKIQALNELVPIPVSYTHLDVYKRQVPILYKKICDTDYEDKELKERKLQVLKDLFQPIDLSLIHIRCV